MSVFGSAPPWLWTLFSRGAPRYAKVPDDPPPPSALTECEQSMCDAVRPASGKVCEGGIGCNEPNRVRLQAAAINKKDPELRECLNDWRLAGAAPVNCLVDYPYDYSPDSPLRPAEEVLVHHYWTSGMSVPQIKARVHALPLYTLSSSDWALGPTGELNTTMLVRWAGMH